MIKNSYPYRILFITSNLGGGGAERVIVNILNHLNRSLFQPYLGLYQREGPLLANLVQDVPIYELQPENYGFLHRNWVRFQAIKNLCQELKPDLVMSILWQANIISIITSKFGRIQIPFLANEQNTPSQEMRALWQRFLYFPLAKKYYELFSGVVAVSNGIANEIEKFFSYPKEKIYVVHNIVEIDRIIKMAELPLQEPLESPSIVSVGRLATQKNHALLIRSLALVIREYPVHLYLVGDGPEREKLENLAVKLGIDANIHFMGFQNNPYSFMKSADLFVLSSNYEGCPNVILEALSISTPVISTDCPNGPREILLNGECGILVPVSDENALAKAILDLLESPKKRKYFSEIGQRRAEDFSVNKIVPQYEEIFMQTIENYANQ